LFKDYPRYAPFKFTGNKLIDFIDLDGLEETKPSQVITDKSRNTGGTINASDSSRSLILRHQIYEINKLVGPSTDPHIIKRPSSTEIVKHDGTFYKESNPKTDSITSTMLLSP
jgi:hypothetical protein